MSRSSQESAFAAAVEQLGELGVDARGAMEKLRTIAVSIHCWQGDDVGGFESLGEEIGGGLAVTGNYPGKARNGDELRSDAEFAMSLIPGKHRFNLHASYAEFSGKKVDRDAIEVGHFSRWMDWSRQKGIPLDFNPTYFAHRLARTGMTLAHADGGVRRFWIEHGRACRRIAAAFGTSQGSPSINNLWIPDGSKDLPADRAAPRQRLRESLDEIYREELSQDVVRDAVEGKLFGLGSEAYVVGSHEFYLGYAIQNRKLLCLDAGHFHPTEVISDKISAVLCWLPEILLHVSRGLRWDSDHVVILNDELQAITQELVRGDFLGRVHLGLDFFDASINRIGAWVIGTRAFLKALLVALLEPREMLRSFEREGNLTARLGLLEEMKMMPYGAIWEHYCETCGVAGGREWLQSVEKYEREVLAGRG